MAVLLTEPFSCDWNALSKYSVKTQDRETGRRVDWRIAYLWVDDRTGNAIPGLATYMLFSIYDWLVYVGEHKGA